MVISTNSLSSLGDPELMSPRSEVSTPREFGPTSPEPNRPRRSHFAKAKETGQAGKASADTDSNKDGGAKKMKVPFANQPGQGASDKQSSSASSLPSDSEFTASQQKPAQAAQAFMSTSGESIAHFIYESYFGAKSLAQRDRRHAALLGCSHVAEYLQLRDGGANVVYSPVMYNNLLAAVIKKFSNDVIPQFQESPMFQIMVYCLILTNYFTKAANKGKRQRSADDEIIAKKSNVLINGVWQACHVVKQQSAADDDSSSSSDSDDDDDEEEKKGGEGDAENKQ